MAACDLARAASRARPRRGRPPRPGSARTCCRQSRSRLGLAHRPSGLYLLSSSDIECEYGRVTLARTNAGPLRARQYATASVSTRYDSSGSLPSTSPTQCRFGKPRHQLRDVAARGLHVDRHRDGVAVVLDQEQHRQLEVARRVQRLPELTLAGRAVAGRDVARLRRPSPCPRSSGCVALEVAVLDQRLGDAHRLQELRAGRARLRDDVELAVAPVARHLAAAGVGILGRAPTAESSISFGVMPSCRHSARSR